MILKQATFWHLNEKNKTLIKRTLHSDETLLTITKSKKK